jgi:hypothetical protein
MEQPSTFYLTDGNGSVAHVRQDCCIHFLGTQTKLLGNDQSHPAIVGGVRGIGGRKWTVGKAAEI